MQAASLLSVSSGLLVYINKALSGRKTSLQQQSDYELLPLDDVNSHNSQHPLHLATSTINTGRDSDKMVNLSAVRVGSVRCE